MTFDPTTVSLSPSDWFSTHIEYEGQGHAEFLDPQGSIEGPVKIRFDEFGESSIEMDVEQVNTEQPLRFGIMELLSGQKPRKVGSSLILSIGIEHTHCTRLVVTSQAGTFSASGNIHFSYQLGENTSLKFHPVHSQFDVAEDGVARYWVLPLSNFLSEFVQRRPELDRHSLRIFPTPTVPGGLPDNEAMTAELSANRKNRLIIFEFNGGRGFIEPLADYDERKGKLQRGRERNLVTAVMIGEVASKPIDFADQGEWLPGDFLTLLGLATGTEVGAPWIEFRDERGKLVRRTHINLGSPFFSDNRPAIRESIHCGTGHLLTKSVISPDWNTSYLRAAMKHVVRGGTYSHTLEDRMDHLCRALDFLCEHYGLGTQRLLDGLTPEQQGDVQKTLRSAVQKVEALAKASASARQFDQCQYLRKIAGRISNAANKDRDFGLAVIDLLKQFSLPDAEILNGHYQAHPRMDGMDWSQILTHYRSVAIHTGYFDVRNKIHNLDDVLTIIDHLHDILLRIILKMLGYDGTYQPMVVKGLTDMRVDWVTPDLPASRLGYRATGELESHKDTVVY